MVSGQSKAPGYVTVDMHNEQGSLDLISILITKLFNGRGLQTCHEMGGQEQHACLHLAFPPLLRKLVTARAMGLVYLLGGSAGCLLKLSSPAWAADSMRESRLVRELLSEGERWWSLPAGLAFTTAPKYFSCSRLEDVSPAAEPVKIRKFVQSNLNHFWNNKFNK